MTLFVCRIGVVLSGFHVTVRTPDTGLAASRPRQPLETELRVPENLPERIVTGLGAPLTVQPARVPLTLIASGMPEALVIAGLMPAVPITVSHLIVAPETSIFGTAAPARSGTSATAATIAIFAAVLTNCLLSPSTMLVR